jgi:heat shock protein HslJ
MVFVMAVGVLIYYPRTNGIQITDIGSTKIGCKYDEWEGYTIQNLAKAFSFSIDGNNLEIYTKGSYNLYFNKN